MKNVLRRGLIAIGLMLAGALINEYFRSDRGHQKELAAQPSHLEESSAPSREARPDVSNRESQALNTKTPDSETLRLRGETAGLKKQVATLKNERGEMLERKALEQRLGKTDLKIAETAGQPFQRNTYYRADLIQDVGNDTASAALQSFIAAATKGDYQTMVQLSPAAAQERLQKLADGQGLGKYVTSDSQGIKISEVAESANDSEFIAEIDFGADKSPVRAHFYTTNELGRWKVLPNVSIEGGQ